MPLGPAYKQAKRLVSNEASIARVSSDNQCDASESVTQAERTAATTALIHETTIAIMSELGYASTTTREIARRSGLTRGAIMHHYPSRTSLLLGALVSSFASDIADFAPTVTQIEDPLERLDVGIDYLWATYKAPHQTAFVEFLVGSRADGELTTAFHAMDAQVRDHIMTLWQETFPELRDNPLFDQTPAFAMAVFDGLTLRRMSGIPGDNSDDLVEILKIVARKMLGPGVTAGAS